MFLSEKKAQERDEDSKRFAAEEKRREEERKIEKEEEGSDSLEKLKMKIKSLQVRNKTKYIKINHYLTLSSVLHTLYLSNLLTIISAKLFVYLTA